MSNPVSRGIPVGPAAEADDDLAQRAVVHVDAAAPADRERVDPELVAVQEVRLEGGGEQVVRGRDGVDVAGEVEVQVFHRHDLGVAAAGGTALDPEDGPERRLAQAEHGVPPDLAQALGERDRRGRLPLARLRRRDRGDADERRVGLAGEPVDDREVDLRLVAAVEVVVVRLEAVALGDLRDRDELVRLRDVEVRGDLGRCHARLSLARRARSSQWLTAAAASSDTSVSE